MFATVFFSQVNFGRQQVFDIMNEARRVTLLTRIPIHTKYDMDEKERLTCAKICSLPSCFREARPQAGRELVSYGRPLSMYYCVINGYILPPPFSTTSVTKVLMASCFPCVPFLNYN